MRPPLTIISKGCHVKKKITVRCQSPSEEPGVGCSGDTFTVSGEETIVWHKKFRECSQGPYLADVDRVGLG